MRKTKSKSLGSVLIVVMALFLSLSFVGCKEKKSIKIYQPENIYEVTPGGELQLETETKNIKEEISYTVVSGDATITETGLLTVDFDAEVSSVITVKATAEGVSSNSISFNVIHLAPTAIDLTANSTMIAKGGKVSLDVVFTPSHATLKDYSLSITTGSEYANLDTTTNELSLKDSFDTAILDSQDVKIVVTATSTADSSITDSVEISVVDAEDISMLVARNVNYNTAKDSNNKYIEVTAYNKLGQSLDVDRSNFTFASDNENIVYVDASGKLIPKSHGTAKITITSVNGITTECYAYIMVPAKEFSVTNINSSILDNEIEFSYSKADPLALNFNIKNNEYSACSDKLEYIFELLDEDDNVAESGYSVAVVTEQGIEFKQTGRVKVTIKTNASLNGANTSSYEKTVDFLVNVNEGINIDTVAELLAYANQQTNIVANINQNILLDENNNFGQANGVYKTLRMPGDRIVNGNGYRISCENLPLLFTEDNKNEGTSLLTFYYKTPGVPFVVKISNLEVIGCVTVNGTYNGTLNYADKNLIDADGDVIRTYDQGIEIIGGTEYNNGLKAYVKDMNLENIKISGFDMGLNISHSVDGMLSNIEIDNCFSNGINSSQNIMTIHNITLGSSIGGFGIEQTSDHMTDKSTNNPKGTAGVNYDETPKITMTGFVVSENYSNGADTAYMIGLGNSVGHSVNAVIEAIIAGVVSKLDASVQLEVAQIVQDCLKNDEGKMNFYQLIFVNPYEFPSYNKGNRENKFAEYASDSSVGNLISIEDVIKNYIEAKAQGQTYDDYKNFDYITVHLDTGADMLGNIGEIIVINQSK